MEYKSPVLEKINFDMTFRVAAKKCAASHFPEVVISAVGTLFDKFPFLSPCLANSDCLAGSSCLNVLERIAAAEFTETHKKFADLEYDLLTFILFGRHGRDPEWGNLLPAGTAVATIDLVYFASKLFGRLVPVNPFNPIPSYNYGEMKLCFPPNDPFFTPLIKNGQPFNWTDAATGVVFVTETLVSQNGYTNQMKKIKLSGLVSTTVEPIGFDVDSTPPPTSAPNTPTVPTTKKPTTNSKDGNGAVVVSAGRAAVCVLLMCLALLF